jgi:hypothetical protein
MRVLLIVLASAIATAQPVKTMCHVSRLYDGSNPSPVQEMNIADDPDPADAPLWAAVGYRIVRSCAGAQVQIEDEVRLVGPSDDPPSRVTLTIILKAGARTERLSIPFSGRLRLEDNFAVGKKFGAAMWDILARIDPGIKAKLQDYFQKHPEANPNR